MSLVNQLGRKGIMYLQAEAGLFVMLDLREFLESSSKVNEWARVIIFRFCPASIPASTLPYIIHERGANPGVPRTPAVDVAHGYCCTGNNGA